MRKWVIRILAACLLLYLAASMLLLPYLIRTQAPGVVHDTVGGTLTIDAVSFNPFIFNLAVDGINFDTPEGEPLLRLEHFEINLNPLDLLWGDIVIANIGIWRPVVTIDIKPDGRFNFDWLLHEENATQSSAKTDNEPMKMPAVILDNFDLDDGMLSFYDHSRPEPLAMTLEPIGLSVTDLRTRGKEHGRIHFYTGTDGGGVLDVKSRLRSLTPFAASGSVSYDAGKLYLAYHFLQSISRLEVANGRFHADLNFDVNLSNPDTTRVDDIAVVLEKLRITSKRTHADVLRLGAMSIVAGPIFPLRQRAQVSSVAFDDLYIAATRLKDGTVDWQHFMLPSESSKTPALEANTTKSSATDSDAPKWHAQIDQATVSNLQAHFEDRSLPTPAHLSLEQFNLTLSLLSTDLKKPVRFSHRSVLNARGSIEANGSVIPRPLKVMADVNISDLALTPFDPYLEARAYARLKRGRIGMTGHIAYESSASTPDLRASGDFGLEDLLIDDTRDAMPLVSIVGLYAHDYHFEQGPDQLFIDRAVLDAFYANVVFDRNKTLNLASLMRPQPDAKTTTQTKAKAQQPSDSFPVRLLRFEVKNGAMHFADLSLPLQFDTYIHDVNGEVLGISTLPSDTAYLSLDGEIDRYGTARARGSLNLADPKTYTGVDVNFRNIDLTSFTPYSGKFIGRAIDKGRLGVTLRYHILGGKMKGDNGIRVQKIDLGHTIESEEAVSLPFDFAIALLEDRDGVIDIDMPVEGDVDNPEFKWGGVVWDAFVNLMTKAVTAPFDLIGSMLGVEGDALKYVNFEAGKSRIDAASREHLDLLSDALEKRPKLAVSVTGTYDKQRDGRALKRDALLAEVLGGDHAAKSDTQTALTPGLLEPLYEKRLGSDALAALQAKVDESGGDTAQKALRYNEALIDALIKSQPLDAKALQKLAGTRAAVIRDYLVTSRGVETARITLKGSAKTKSERAFVASKIGLEAAKQ